MTFMNLPITNGLIDAGGLILLLIIIVGFIFKIRTGVLHRFDFLYILDSFKGNNAERKEQGENVKSGRLISSIASVLLYDVFTTRPLKTCDTIKRAAHLLIFWGFVSTGISTTLAYLMNPDNAILPLTNPVKVFGNLGGILIAAGFVVMFYIRYQESGSMWKLTRADYFLLVLFFTVITGFITQQAIYSYASPGLVSATFWIHMVLIVLLLATAPFTKFSHALYKPIWLLHEELNKRQDKEPLLPTPGETDSATKSDAR